MNNDKQQKTKKSELFGFRMTPKVKEMLRYLADQKGWNLTMVIHYLIDEAYRKQQKELYGYQGSARLDYKKKKDQKADQFAETVQKLKDMTPEELQRTLVGVGYFEADKFDGFQTFAHRIVDDATGARYYYQKYYNKEGEETYSRLVFTFDELIKDLQKEKKL